MKITPYISLLIFFTLINPAHANQANTNTPECNFSQTQLKRVQALLKQGETKKWGRDLVSYQDELFKHVDKTCFPETGVAAINKPKKVVKRGQQQNIDLSNTKPKLSSKAILKKHNIELSEEQIAEIGPASDRVNKAKAKPTISKKLKAWNAWFTPSPECTGTLEIKMFVWCNKLEKAQKIEFDKLWKQKNQ